MAKQNFLIGKGERLTSDIVIRSGGVEKIPPYNVKEAKQRLGPMIKRAVAELDRLPDAATLDDKVVTALTLNPEFIAKSYYLSDLLREAGLEAVGSKPNRITPDKRSRGRAPKEAMTTDIFVVGTRTALRKWAASVENWNPDSKAAKELARIEKITAPSVEDKIKGRIPKHGDLVYEVVLHTDESEGEGSVIKKFGDYLRSIGLDPPLNRRFYAGGLCFLEVQAPAGHAREIATHSIVRAVRQMPRLRLLRPTVRTSSGPPRHVTLPTESPVTTQARAAIFDGGVDANHPISKWVKSLAPKGIGSPQQEYLNHGLAVTSAFLFGHIDPKVPIPRPYCHVDHHRVLDSAPGQDPRELFQVLERIQSILTQESYQFVNLSIGPILPVEDDDVHAWTAVLDEILSSRNILATIAVGNTGESDKDAGLNRIQVPADCVNALSVGACDSPDKVWQRASYSSIGPGRSPGFLKPDLVAFGGATERPFLVVGDNNGATIVEPIAGTSFAAPSVLRVGAGVHAHFGNNLDMLAIRALILHCTESSDLPPTEVGRGRCPNQVEQLVLCDDDTIRVVYQGSISAAKYIRAPIPLPSETLNGKILISATLCCTTATDPHHPGNYTRAGIEAIFRPHEDRLSRDEQVHPDSKDFFGKARRGLTEQELRSDAWKWENILHAKRSFYGTSLKNPVFDIHYISRLAGQTHNPTQQLQYALVISVTAKREPDLYDRVVRRFSSQIEPLRPLIDIPVRT